MPRPTADPGKRPHEALVEAGYELAAERIVEVGADAERRVVVERDPPANTAGFYFRWRALTYGSVVINRGARGPVTVQLVNTTDSGSRVIAERTIHMDAGERREVWFRTTATFETVRVEAHAGS